MGGGRRTTPSSFWTKRERPVWSRASTPAARLVNLAVKLYDEETLDPETEDLRSDLATAAALVYVGRIGYD